MSRAYAVTPLSNWRMPVAVGILSALMSPSRAASPSGRCAWTRVTGASAALQQIEAAAGAVEQGVGLMDGQRQQRAEATAVNQLMRS